MNIVLEGDLNDALTLFFKYPHQDNIPALTIIAENIETAYKQNIYQGKLLKDPSLLIGEKITHEAFAPIKKVTENVSNKILSNNEDKKDTIVNPYPKQKGQRSYTEKKSILGMIKGLGTEIKEVARNIKIPFPGGRGPRLEKEEEVILPIQSKKDALDRLQILQYKYKGKMTDNDFNTFTQALTFLNDNM